MRFWTAQDAETRTSFEAEKAYIAQQNPRGGAESAVDDQILRMASSCLLCAEWGSAQCQDRHRQAPVKY